MAEPQGLEPQAFRMDRIEDEIPQSPLRPLAEFVIWRRDAILAEWRRRAAADDNTAVPALLLSRAEFYDHIPEFLDRLCAVFCGGDAPSMDDCVRKHGTQRWRQASLVLEVAQEWGHLHRVLAAEIGHFQESHPEFSNELARQAYDIVLEQIHNASAVSLEEFFRHQRFDADTRLRQLEEMCRQQGELQVARGENLRESTHDLKGNLHLILMATELLKTSPLDESSRYLVEQVGAAADNLHQLLGDLLDLARLEAGREERSIAEFDAGELLHDLAGSMQAAAQKKGLKLTAQGPTPFLIQGDRTKIYRIAQNVTLNALKYTEVGEVRVTWELKGTALWTLVVRDTGPGFTQSQHEKQANKAGNSAHDSSRGEGVGLTIVHRLCELLDGRVEIASSPDQGTAIRIILPTAYPVT